MGKKLMCLAMAAVCACGLIAMPRGSVFAETTEDTTASTTERQEALFLELVSLTVVQDSEEPEDSTEAAQADGDVNYALTFKFTKAVSTEAAELDENMKKFFVVNGTALSEVEGVKAEYTEDDKVIVVTLPESAGLIDPEGTTRIYLLGGFISETNCVTTVRYIYDFPTFGYGTRVYRSDNNDDYDEVTVTSIGTPTKEGSNFTFYVYFSDTISPKKYIDLQVRRGDQLRTFHGERGDKQYSDAELILLEQYEIYSSVFEHSMNHAIWFGCDSMQDMKAFPKGNGSYTDMTPKTVASNGIQLFDVYQIQAATADTDVYYYNKDGDLVSNGSSQLPLVVQLHVEDNHLQVVLKGDSDRDSLIGEKGIYGVENLFSFNENIAPNQNKEKMAFGLKTGLLFPNGRIIKADVLYVYDPVKKSWTLSGETAAEAQVDQTLSNQEGYTDAELALLAKAKK